jgi:general secretion pathway protein D
VLNSAGQVRATLNALASDNRANILSSPRVMARNGELATIQVGQEVPIITSQATGVGSGTTSGQLLQTVQYRSTGVILKVKPIIHSSDQIDLDVMQEVSAASTTETGVAASPTFSTRRVDTKLSLQNGATVILGGLISEERSDGNSGIPLLKDLPVLGSIFSKQSWSGRRRELVVLITPYVVSTNRDAEELTRAFRSMLRPWNVAPASAPQKP